MERIPVLICIDVEPDDRAISRGHKPDWAGFEKSCEFFMKLRPRLQSATGMPAHFSWFLRMDPQITHTYGLASWCVTRYPGLFDAIESAGDEAGLHPHPWRWDEDGRRWFQDFASQAWVDHCVHSSFDTFRRSFRRPCRSLRFGDRWMSNETMALAERLGAAFDLTVEPGRKAAHLPDPFTGHLPDYTPAPRFPYRPSKADFRICDFEYGRRLRVIPISTGRTDWANSPPASRARAQDVNTVESLPPHYEGFHDTADCSVIAGWVWDKSLPGTNLNVEILDGETLLATVVADLYRPDLLRAGKGEGRHGFRWAVPDSLKDGRPHSIRVKVSGSDFDLYGTSQNLTCAAGEGAREEYETLNLASCPIEFPVMTDKLLKVAGRPYLALVVRSDAILREGLRASIEYNVDYILSHPLVEELVFETPPEMLRRMA